MGVAVHYGRLPNPFLRELEILLSDGVLKVIIASPTLSQGLNLNAAVLLFRLSIGRANRSPVRNSPTSPAGRPRLRRRGGPHRPRHVRQGRLASSGMAQTGPVNQGQNLEERAHPDRRRNHQPPRTRGRPRARRCVRISRERPRGLDIGRRRGRYREPPTPSSADDRR